MFIIPFLAENRKPNIFIFDSCDQGAEERLEILNDRDGVWRCRTIFNCTNACPREIKVTQTIGEVKRLLLFNRMP